MIIDRSVARFLVYEGESIVHALEKINQNQRRIVFVVSTDGILMGSLSDGDVRRWITSTALVDVNLPVENAMNLLGSSPLKEVEEFTEGFVPINT